MKFSTQPIVALPLLARLALASSGSVSCQTALGTASVQSVPSTTLTTTAPASTTTVVAQPTTTAFLGLTSTLVDYVTLTTTTTTTPATDMVTTTTTIYSVSTLNYTSTITTTSTETDTTSSTSTTYSATTSGFQPIADTLNQNTFPGQRKRALDHPHQVRALTSGSVGVQKLLATSYPTSVICTSTAANTKTKTVTSNAPAVTVTSAYWARHVTILSLLTSTSTVYPPDVTSTETDTYVSTVSTTTTLLTTTTASATTTTTNIIPGPTIWAACSSNNIFGPNFQHNGIAYYAANVANNGPGVASNFQILADGASTATDCCAACQTATSCETFIFRATSRNCFLLNHSGETCPNQLNHPNYILSTKGSDTGAGYVVGNGNCGFTYSGNSDSSVFSVDSGSIPS